MVTIEKAVIARVNRKNKHFEILVDPELAYDFKSGKPISISKCLAVNEVFKDSKKGVRASSSDLQTAFGTTDVEEIAKHIIKDGEIQLTTQLRREKLEERKRQIATFISKNAINPQTKLPHPIKRILTAIDKAGVDIDPFKPASSQTEDVVKALKPILPISMERIKLQIHIPAQYAARAYGVIKTYGIEYDKWLADGSLQATITIPAGLREEVFHKLGAITQGNVEIREM